MATMPAPVAELLDRALVGELTVIDANGRPVTYPLIPLWDGERVYLTSSTLFSKKLEHIDANPKVSVSITDPVAVDGRTDRATIQGDARVIADDPHGGWERLLPIWSAKEPAIVAFLKVRVALPLFFERALIEVTPRRALYWSDGSAANAPVVDRHRHREGGRLMRSTPELDTKAGLTKLTTYPYQIATWVDDDGYPVSRRHRGDDRTGRRHRVLRGPDRPDRADRRPPGVAHRLAHPPAAGLRLRRAAPRDGVGTRHGLAPAGRSPSMAGPPGAGTRPRSRSSSTRSARSPQSRKYFDALSAERGTPVKPRLSFGFLALRTTRLPFLTATIIPVLLGIIIAASHGSFDLVAAALTVIGASFVQLGLNVANDVFDTVQGADDANITPTQFSGGSRVIQYGLVSLRQMATLATVFYLLAGLVGLILLATHGSPALLVIGVVGFIVSLGYTAPPLKFVYRGLGEIAVAIGFGPLMLLGAYVVQTGGALAWEPFVASIPIALLVALILYVNEIPDRRGDARAGKRTLPVRFSETTVITGYRVAAAAAFVALVIGVVAGILPVPTLLMLLTIPLALQVSRGLAAELRQPVWPDGDHGRQRPAPPAGRAAAARRIRDRADPRRGRAVDPGVPRLDGSAHGPGPGRDREWTVAESLVAAVPELRLPFRVQARGIGARRADPMGERLPPRVEGRELEVGGDRRFLDIAQAGGFEQLGQVALTDTG